jgi:putative ABC transport system substrate-binding protein
MKRREFIALVGGATAWSFVARAQQTGDVRRVGVLMGGAAGDPTWQAYVSTLRNALADLGWVEGRNLRIDIRFGEGDISRMNTDAAELVRLAPEVIVTVSGAAMQAMQRETQTIPIVAVGLRAGDSGASALPGTIARPNGNVTGFPILYGSIGGKWLELLKELAPDIDRVALISAPDVTAPPDLAAHSPTASYTRTIEAAAQAMGVKVIDLPFRDTRELTRKMIAFAAEPNGGVIITPSVATATRDNREALLSLASQHRLPVIHWDRAYPLEGGLMSYGSDMIDLHRRSAAYVDRMLRGAKVNDLPVQYPTKFELLINGKTVKALGLTIPRSLLTTADEVIE